MLKWRPWPGGGGHHQDIPNPTKQKRSAEIVKAVQKLAVARDLLVDKVALLVD